MNSIGEVIRQEAGDSVEKTRVKFTTRMTESERSYCSGTHDLQDDKSLMLPRSR